MVKATIQQRMRKCYLCNLNSALDTFQKFGLSLHDRNRQVPKRW